MSSKSFKMEQRIIRSITLSGLCSNFFINVIAFLFYIAMFTNHLHKGLFFIIILKKHPLKNKAGGNPVVIAPIILYSDDFSGNRSKKWNKFDAWCLTLAGS